MSASSPSATGGPSSFERHGEKATLVFERQLRHSPESVWKAITDPQEMAQWCLTTGEIEGRVGGRLDLTTGPMRVHSSGRVLVWDPPRRFEYEWNVDPGPSYPEGEHAVVSWELVAREGGTRLVLTHRDLTVRAAHVFEHGLVGFLDRLQAQLDHRPLPDWWERVKELRSAGSAPP